MGCCCSRNEEDDVELSKVTNITVSSKIGKLGEEMKSTMNSSTGSYIIQGRGTAIGSCILECDAAYWEIKIGDNPEGICIGVKRCDPVKNHMLNTTLDESDADNWFVDATKVHWKSGDVVGVYWDQIDKPMLSFSLNGVMQPDAAHTRIRPANNIVPAVSIKQGSTCHVIFDGDHFAYPPKSSRYGMIVCATSLI